MAPWSSNFPLPPIERKAAIEHNEFLKNQLSNGAYTGWRKGHFEKEVRDFDPRRYPKQIPRETREKSCTVFGHICPVFFANEPFTETIEQRRITRHIPREVMLR